jgi:hypothetical protein
MEEGLQGLRQGAMQMGDIRTETYDHRAETMVNMPQVDMGA